MRTVSVSRVLIANQPAGCSKIKNYSPTKLTWIDRTAKTNDRIDARQQAVLLSMNEMPRVHMPREGVREWRRTIQDRRNLVNTLTQTKKRTRSLLKIRGLKKAHRGTWWNTTNRTWMRQEADRGDAPWRDRFKPGSRASR